MKFIEKIPKSTFIGPSILLMVTGLCLLGLVIAAAVDPSRRPDCSGEACWELSSGDVSSEQDGSDEHANKDTADQRADNRSTGAESADEDNEDEQRSEGEGTDEDDQRKDDEDTDEDNEDDQRKDDEDTDEDNEDEDEEPTDEEIADTLNGELNADMAGNMTDDHVSHARAMVEAAQERDMDQRAATIAVTTAIVETHLDNLDWGDRDSVGLFQQRDHYGSQDQRLDPTWAVNAFFDEMKRVYPDEGWNDEPIGDVAQGAQRSAYPDRYQHQVDDAEIIVDHLW